MALAGAVLVNERSVSVIVAVSLSLVAVPVTEPSLAVPVAVETRFPVLPAATVAL